MIDFYVNSSIYIQVIIACTMTWFITSLGSSIVFFFKTVNKTILDGMLGFSAGVMIAASFWSLLNPAIDKAIELKMEAWFIVFLGFITGGILLFISDFVFDNILNKKNINNQSGVKRSLMLIFSITLHNIPEGYNKYAMY